jgi:hypothetical protein
MDLFDLDDLIPSLGIDPTDDHLEELYEVFERDFINETYFINGVQVRIDMRASREDGFEDYPHTFVKLITRGSKGKRVFDRKRANKIHWIKVILDNRHTEDVLFFQFKEANGDIRDYYWFKEGDFLVILIKVTPNFIIVSGFHIDDERNRKFYESRFESRLK